MEEKIIAAIIVSAIAFLTIYAFTPILIKFLEKRNLAVKDVNKKDYPPRSKKISFVIKKFEEGSLNKLTLGGCVLRLNDSHITIQKEVKKPDFH